METAEIGYSFVVTAYNAQNSVVVTLESIRIQVEKYGKGQKVQLIVADDASTDKTIQMAEMWLEDYGNLFARVDRVYHEKNMGACSLFVDAMKSICGRRFKEISDDVLPEDVNMFELMDMTDDYDIVASNVLSFDEEGILPEEQSSYRISSDQRYYSEKRLRKYLQYMCVIQNGVVWSLRLMTDSVYEYMLQFKYIEEDPLFCKIFRENETVRYKYVNKVAMFYRRKKGSLTRLMPKQSSVRQQMCNDQVKLLEDNYGLSKSLICKWIIRKKIKALNSGKGYNPIPFRIRYRLHWKAEKKEFAEIMKNREEYEIYLERLNAVSAGYLARLEEE
jgi:glycosyltransferase involved in cell wall biosynthesis